MDGTLVDTERYSIAAEHAVVQEAGGVWHEHYSHELIGKDLLVSAAFIRANSPITAAPEEIVHMLLLRVIAQVREHVPWRPGARELLAELNALAVPCALVTMSWRSLTDAVLGTLPDGSFTAIVTGDEVTHGKPHPEPYRAAARLLQVAPEACVAIEDSPTGVLSAVQAGVPTLAVPHIVPIPPISGAVQVPSLTGMTAADLGVLVNGHSR